MLSAEQLEARTRSIGASDAHLLAGIDGPGNRTLLDLWSRKRRGKHLEIAPLVEPEEDDDKPGGHGALFATADPKAVGSAFESSVVALYSERTGFETVESEGERHERHEWATCTPDRIVIPAEHGQRFWGLECKMVGRWALDRWNGEGLAPYVVCQAQWSMGVTGHDRWDVAAWLAGTEVRLVTVLRDEEMIEGLFELGQRFWEDHVLGDLPPTPSDAEDAVRFLGRRFPKDDGSIIVAPPEAEALAMRHERMKAAEKRAAQKKAEVLAELIRLVGDHKGLEGEWGRFTYGGRAGRVGWKAVAEELAGGVVPDSLTEDHRGAPYRAPSLRLYGDR